MFYNSNLNNAKKDKNDEFYTQLKDIEKELEHYKSFFKDKIVYCNCDKPEKSNFWKYFFDNFNDLGLKKLVATYLDSDDTYKTEFNGIDIVKTSIIGFGDFRSFDCLTILDEVDVVVTNPPFSLFREFLSILVEHNKYFLILSNQNAITFKDTFSLLKNDKMWLGYYSGDMSFKVPSYYEPRETRYWVDDSGQKWRSMGNICWFTNIEHNKRHNFIELKTRKELEESGVVFKKYDNLDALNVDKVTQIPSDYKGQMGVPITFLDKYCPEQFKILGLDVDLIGVRCTIGGKSKYCRVIIQKI